MAEYSISKNSGRPMDVVTNSFCAGGSALGNGTWLNVGGNQAVAPGGVQAQSQLGGGIYDDPDGGRSYVHSHLVETRYCMVNVRLHTQSQVWCCIANCARGTSIDVACL